MLKKNSVYPIKYKTDLDLLFQHDIVYNSMVWDYYYWSAPKWMTAGDILFYYHALAADQRTEKLLKEAKKDYSANKDLISQLEHAVELAQKYAGKNHWI